MSKTVIFFSIGLLLGLTHFVCSSELDQHLTVNNGEQHVDVAAAPAVIDAVNVANANEDQTIDAAPAKTEIWNDGESSKQPHVRVARQFFFPPPFFGPPPLRFYGGGGGFYGRGFYGRRRFGGFYGGRRFVRRRFYG